jgi:hypothetical protein
MQIFMSYRRKDWSFARSLKNALHEYLDAEIFIDFEGVDEANFDSSIMRHLRTSDAYLLIVSEHTFADRIFRSGDWMRREILEALTLNIPIICAFINGQMIPGDIPDEITLIRHMQGISFYPEFFDAAVEKLARFIIKVTPIDAREFTSVELHRKEVTEKCRKLLQVAQAALNEGDHPAFASLLEEVLFLLSSLKASNAASNDQQSAGAPALPPLPKTLPEETPVDATRPRLSSESATESANLENPLEWGDDAEEKRDENPLEDLMNLLKQGKSSSEILDWFYPRPPADSAD